MYIDVLISVSTRHDYMPIVGIPSVSPARMHVKLLGAAPSYIMENWFEH